ncbi:MAG TPA: CHAD domain-containing protein, partial [Rhizomicrobium sp.]|nr:CHAD domain-containing protein [Rhizomicrobium sp.]
MGQQFEFKLEDELRRSRRFAPGQLPAVIEQEPRARPLPVKARPAILARDIAAEDAFRLTLLQCKWHIASNIAAIVEAREVEGVHQMRVGFRRLRVALTAFGGDFRTPALEALGARAKRLADKLAPARDLDVFIDELLEPAADA